MQEFCNGGTLRDAVVRGAFTTEKLPKRWAAIVNSLTDVAAGLEYIHRKRICHGDLNPANILLKVRSLRCVCAGTLEAVRSQLEKPNDGAAMCMPRWQCESAPRWCRAGCGRL